MPDSKIPLIISASQQCSSIEEHMAVSSGTLNAPVCTTAIRTAVAVVSAWEREGMPRGRFLIDVRFIPDLAVDKSDSSV